MEWSDAFQAKAVSCLRGARLLLMGRHHDSAASRAYFAVCLAMTAALGQPAPGTRRHHGAFLRLESLARARLLPSDARSIKRLYAARLVADYEIGRTGAEESEELVAAAASLLARMGLRFP